MTGVMDGYLLIADITGYTGYLSRSELDHAQEILTHLLKLIVKHTRPPLVISHLAGDAVLSYGLRDHFLSGQVFVESIEETYVAFRQAIQFMLMNSTCECNACANISLLDLKFFVHFGSFGIQKINQNDELIGSEVNLVHRLLKNHVAEATGRRAYCLYTEAAVHALEIEDLSQKMLPHSESYEHLGQVQVWIQDMQPAWSAAQNQPGEALPAERVAASEEIEIAAPLQTVWEAVILPEYRAILTASDRQEVNQPQGGRIAPGSVYHCHHGDDTFDQVVISWKPFEILTTRNRIPIPLLKTYIQNEIRLIQSETGTRLVMSVSKPEGPLPAQMLVKRMLPQFVAETRANLQNFKAKIEADVQTRRTPLEALVAPSDAMLAEAIRSSLAPVSN